MLRLLVVSLLVTVAAMQGPAIVFENITPKSGIRFQNVFGSPEKSAITDVNGSGAAFFDYDRDGLVDIYLVNGARKENDTPGNALYRNLGNGTFADVTDKAGVRERRW